MQSVATQRRIWQPLTLDRLDLPERFRETLTAAQKRAYWSKLRGVRREIGSLDRRNQLLVRAMLQDARRTILAEIASARGFSAYYLRELTAEFNRALAEFAARYGKLMDVSAISNADLAARLTLSPVPAGVIPRTGWVGLSPEVMESAATMRGELITNLTSQAITDISRQVRFHSMGITDFQQAMGAIGRNLTDPSVFGTIATRAETILRTEMGRIRGQATVAAMDQIKDVPGLKKMWLWSGISRQEHAQIDGVTVGLDENFTDGFGNSAPAPHLFGRPESDINCGCEVAVVMEEGESE
jgi:hypothetical protein